MPTPQAPASVQPSQDDARYELWTNVKDALRALPGYFRSTTNIEGLAATDLFTLNSTLGATIEVQMIETLNAIRKVWDPEDEWQLHSFERQAQTFPDVRLVARRGEDIDIPFAIELKGWYLLSKEQEPSFRYQVTPDACSDWDLLVVVPWYLDNVLAGRPRVLPPFIASAKYAAQYRNYWWKYVRQSKADTMIDSPTVTTPPPYPSKADRLSDKPKADSGKNFGRVARIGLMDDYVDELLNTQVSGIRAGHWVDFFRMYTESKTQAQVDAKLAAARERISTRSGSSETQQRMLDVLEELLQLIEPVDD